MKKTRVGKNILMLSLAVCVFMLVGCGGTTSSTTATQTPAPAHSTSTTTEQPVPVGNSTQASGNDIPDTQTFVTYTSSVAKYQLQVPEGWAQTVKQSDVSFVNNLNALGVTLTSVATQPTVSSVLNNQTAWQQSERAVRDVQAQNAQLPGGLAVLITYTSNSEPNAVTGKQVRLENNRYLFFKNGKLAMLTLSAPVGADNVDQWRRIANSFKWV
jgi:hypothetical protein